MSLTFNRFQTVNAARNSQWKADSNWTLSDWATATAGELGEACNLITKLHRAQDGIIGNRGRTEADLKEQLREELADTLTYLFLLADEAGIDLETEVRKKFNKVSQEHGFPQRV